MHALPARHLVSTTCTVDNVTNAMYCNMLPDVFTLFSGQPGMILSFSFCFSFSFSFLFFFSSFFSLHLFTLLCIAGEALMTEETIEHITGVIAAKGSDAWYQMPVQELLPDSLKDQADKLDKGQDTMDVW